MALIGRLAVSLAAASLLLTADPEGESLALQRAREEAARLQELVAAGAVPKARLDQVNEQIADAEDEALLRRTLYGNLSVEDLTDAQAQEMVEAARRRTGRQQRKVDYQRTLADSGVASRLSVTPLLEDLDHRRRALDLAVGRARLLTELMEMAQAEQEQQNEPEISEPRRVAERYDGSGLFSDTHLKTVLAAYARNFGRPMPVSAMGMTALHRSMGFDHRGRVDVALNPDQEEGVWLRAYLESAGIPYIAFRAAVPGQATAPHIHIGPPSNRIRFAD